MKILEYVMEERNLDKIVNRSLQELHEVGLTQILGGRLAKNLTTNQFFYFWILKEKRLKEYTKNFSTSFGGLFSLSTTSKGHQLQSLASQRLAMTFVQFSPQLLTYSIKRA